MLNIYINSEIKGGEFLEDPTRSFEGFLKWYSLRLEKRIDTLKSEKGRMRAIAKGEEELSDLFLKKIVPSSITTLPGKNLRVRGFGVGSVCINIFIYI